MAQKPEERGVTTGLVVGALGGGAVAAVIATLLAARPARAAPTDEKLDYLIEVLTTLVPVLADVSERQATLIQLLEQWLAAQGIPGIPEVPEVPGIEVTVLTPWIATDPIQIFQQAIRNIGVFQSDSMVDMRKAKRIVVKAESSLDQAVTIQLVGNLDNTFNLATNVGAPAVCPIGGNASLGIGLGGLWQPFIGVLVTSAVAPISGILTLRAVLQE